MMRGNLNWIKRFQQFNDLRENEKFCSFFKKYRFFAENETQKSACEYLPENFTPFFVEEHDGFEDYYCLERESSEDFGKVIILSKGSIVMEWDRWDDFIIWIKENW